MRDLDKQKEWNRKNIFQYRLTFNKETEKDVYRQFAKQKNKRSYLINLIRKDIK